MWNVIKDFWKVGIIIFKWWLYCKKKKSVMVICNDFNEVINIRKYIRVELGSILYKMKINRLFFLKLMNV